MRITFWSGLAVVPDHGVQVVDEDLYRPITLLDAVWTTLSHVDRRKQRRKPSEENRCN